MNLKGIFKGIVPDISTGAGVALSGKVLSMVPVANDQPLLKNAGAYLLLKMVGGKIKGVPGDFINGLKYGAIANAVGVGLTSAGVTGIESAYINGTDRYVYIEPTNPSVDNAYVTGVDPMASEF